MLFSVQEQEGMILAVVRLSNRADTKAKEYVPALF
jgi:hypothetical protein